VAISTDIADVPYYAARSLLRMFIALALSTAVALVYGTAAARLRRVEKVLVPILDILQSIPILVFLPIALTFFIAAAGKCVFGVPQPQEMRPGLLQMMLPAYLRWVAVDGGGKRPDTESNLGGSDEER
jgi:ABC-type proline/glycine betaine transport system permease subunit